MGMQRFYASPSDSFTWPNGAVGYRPGGPFDCLGPFAKVLNCPLGDSDYRVTAYATGYADTYFSIPAHCMVRGHRVRGYLTTGEEGISFRPFDSEKGGAK